MEGLGFRAFTQPEPLADLNLRRPVSALLCQRLLCDEFKRGLRAHTDVPFPYAVLLMFRRFPLAVVVLAFQHLISRLGVGISRDAAVVIVCAGSAVSVVVVSR